MTASPSFLRRMVMIVMLAGGTAVAQEARQPINTPFLMIAGEMHVGIITGIATDPSAALVATGSADKSIRLFDGTDGRFLRRVVLPLGDEQIGAVASLALAPDGKRLFAATVSFDTGNAAKEGSLYLVDPASGQLLGRAKELPAVPGDVNYSPNGKLIALTYPGLGFDLLTAQVKRLVRDVSQPIEALSLTDDVVVTISEAADVRVFAVAGDKLERRHAFKVRAAGLPATIALAPDGKRFAVGYRDRPFVDVVAIDGSKKTRLEAPQDLTGSNLAMVAWTRGDIPTLVAGGTVQTPGLENVLLAWRDGRSDAASAPLAVSADAVTDLVPAGASGVAFATADPAWGRVEVEDGGALRTVTRRDGERLDFRELPSRGFEISRDGGSVVFSDHDLDAPQMRFDLATLELTRDPPPSPDLVEPDPARISALLGAWFHSTTPSMKGRRLELGQRERALSADVRDDGGTLILGTDYRLRLYDGAGRERASRRLTAAAWAVVMAPDRPLAVAALGDGTIRWYSLRDDSLLAEIAGLFVADDGRRWVAWTGDGLFATADEGGAGLVGYQQNGTTQAPTGTWLGFDRAYRLFYDPEAVRRVLDDQASWPAVAANRRVADLLDGLAAPKLAIEAYCPMEAMPAEVVTRGLVNVAAPGKTVPRSAPGGGCVELPTGGPGSAAMPSISVPVTTQAIRLRIGVTAGSRGLASIDTLIGGRNAGRVELPKDAGTIAAGQDVMAERVVPLADNETTLVLRAYDAGGLATASAPLLVRREGEPPPPPRTLHVLAVGVDAYGGEWPRLSYAVADARTFSDLIRAGKPEAYAQVDVTTIENGDAIRERVETALGGLAGRARPNDALLVYLAGHGLADDDGRYVFVTSDATSVDKVKSAEQGISGPELLKRIAEIPARSKFLFLDTCYSGAFDMKGPDQLAHEGGFLVLTAASDKQAALDSLDGKNGTLAYTIRRKLTDPGAADGGPVDALDLGSYARTEVKRFAAQKKWQQSASFKTAAGDLEEFPIADVRPAD